MFQLSSRQKNLIFIGFGAFLILLVWLLGPYLFLKSVLTRVVATVVIVIAVLSVFFVMKIKAYHSSEKLEKGVEKDTRNEIINAKPGERPDLSELRGRLMEAIKVIKHSELGKTRGRAALYELPWYMILGHASSGKSSAIEHSGLHFPLKGKGIANVKGVGGTRNCDWHFATEGVLLDTAGRFSMDGEDHKHWLGFLKLLKHERPQAPLNGILLAISLTELRETNQGVFEANVRELRHRIDEVDQAFDARVPIYIMVTKMDLLGGFAAFFQDLSAEIGEQVWGATLTHEQEVNFDGVKSIGEHFDALHQGLSQMALEKMALKKESAFFTFPIEFHSLREPLCRFVENLLQDDTYFVKPLIRGICFSSALQEGTPEPTLGASIAARYHLTPPELPVSSAPSRSYFLKSFFTQVLFPDQFLIGSKIRPGKSRTRLFALAGGLLGLTILSGIWAMSFTMNQKLIRQAAAERKECSQTLITGQTKDKLAALLMLQLRLEQLDTWQKQGRPLSYGWGLYQGNEIEKSLWKDYCQAVKQLMLEPVKGSLEVALDRFLMGGVAPTPPSPLPTPVKVSRRGRRTVEAAKAVQPAVAEAEAPAQNSQETAYNALKTYLMLQDVAHRDATHLADQLTRYWRPWLEKQLQQEKLDDSTHRMAERIVAFFVSRLQDEALPTLDIHQPRVQSVRARLRGEIQYLSPYQRLYNQMKAEGNTRFPATTVGRILNNQNLDLLGGSASVMGSFSGDAWQGFFKNAIQEAAHGRYKGNDWVLDASVDNDLTRHGEPDKNAAALLTLYKAEYIQQWERFLAGIGFLCFDTPEKTVEALGRLGAPQGSPLRQVLVHAAKETSWDNPIEGPKAIENLKKSVLERTNQLLGTGQAAPGPSTSRGEIGNHFAALASMTAGDKAAIDGYLDLLQKLRNKLGLVNSAPDPASSARQMMQATMGGSGSELTEGLNYVEGVLLSQANDSLKAALRALLLRPIQQSADAVMPLVEQDLNRAWQQHVYGAWSNLASKFPFADSSNEAALSDIVHFLKPGEGTLPRFIDKYLSGFVSQRSDHLSARAFGGTAVLSPSFLDNVSRLLLAANEVLQNGETCRFELQPQPTAGVTETHLEIQGEKLIYRNGPQFWKSFTWPNPNGATGIQLRLVSESGASNQLHNCRGRLDLMRWLDMARVDNPNAPSATLEWPISGAQVTNAKGGKGSRVIRLGFRVVSGANPLKLKTLRHHTLPSRITR